MNTRRAHFAPTVLAVALPMAVAAVLVVVAGFVSPQQPDSRQTVSVQTSRTLSCAFAGAPGQLFSTDQGARVTTLDGTAIAQPATNGAIPASVLVSGRGADLGAGVRSQSSAGLMWAECQPPATLGTLVVPRPATSEIVLVNPDRTDASVNISLSGATGEIQSAGLRGIVVPASSTVRVPVSVHAPDGAPVAATYRTSQGRVQAAVRSLTGPEQAVSLVPQRIGVFAALPLQPSQVQLVLHNPGNLRAEVRVEMLGPRGRFAPANGNASLEPNTTVTLDLTAAFKGEPMGLLVTGSADVVSMVETTGANDLAWVLPQSAASDLVDAVPEGTLQVVNPGQVEVSVSVAGAPATTIAAGASVEQSVTGGPLKLTSTGPIAAGVRIKGSGQTVVRLRPASPALTGGAGQLDPRVGR